jgi:hypothetical protein
MEAFQPERKRDEEIMNEDLNALVHELSDIAGESLSLDLVGGTYEIEGDNFTLTFTIDESTFKIRSIDVHGNSGLGRQIITVIHEYADEHDLEVIASNVRDTARGFWVRMGYQEGEEADEYYRAA